MKIGSIIANNSIKLLSGLSNNNDSILPMTVKDTISNCAIVATYKSKGGKDDARERAIEEFGTGAVWLFGIPTIKAIINKTVYPLLNLKSEFDIRLLKKEDEIKNILNNSNNASVKEIADVFNNLDKQNPILKNFTNKSLYKGLFLSKFEISTIASAILLSKIIKYKQKTTKNRIEKEIETKKNQIQYNREFLGKKVKNSNVYNIFKGNKDKNVSFTGALDLFMYNPIANTSILDGVITTTRLKEARHGERKEVALKEAFQIFFIYAIAKPTQMLFEKIGRKLKVPVELDPNVIFSKEAKDEIKKASQYIKQNGLNKLNENELLNKIYTTNDVKNPLIQLLAKNGNIELAKNQKSINYLKYVDEKELKKTINNILEANKNVDKNLKGMKAYKAISVLSNIAIGALAMGVLQPMVNIAMRKLLNNGDNRNPAIVQQEQRLKELNENI